MRMASGAYEGPYTFQSRFEEGDGTNPEELIAAAHAGCFSMALSGDLGRAGHEPESVETTATVHLEKVEGGFAITRIVLDTRARVPGIDADGVPARSPRARSRTARCRRALAAVRGDRAERRAGRVTGAADARAARAAAAAAAVELVEPGMTIGLGSGRAVWKVVELLGRPRRAGARGGRLLAHRRAGARGAASRWSSWTAAVELDLALDGADEVDPELRLIKGGGGALLREKIVISAARRFVVVAEAAKRVERLGERFRLPVEVVRFGVARHAPPARRAAARRRAAAAATTASRT